MNTKKLTFLESVMLVAGAGIGTGILTIPYAIAKIGIWGTLVALVLAYIASAAMYLVIADLTRNSVRSDDLLGILDEHLFGEKGKKPLHILFLVMLVLLLLENLVVYILSAGQVIADLLSVKPLFAYIIFYLLASLVVMFGVKGMGVGEKISVCLISLVVLLLGVLSLIYRKSSLSFTFGRADTVFAVYGLFMFAFSAIFSVMQVCNHIAKPEKAGKAILFGLTLNALITLLFSLATVIGSVTVTEIATVGLSDGIGIPFVKVLCGVLVLFAMFTSFWSSGFAFSDVIGGQCKTPYRLSWLIATLPALLLTAVLPLTLLDFIQIGAGALSVILVLVVLPAYAHAVKYAQKPLLLGRHSGKKRLLISVAIAILLMSVSSFIPIR